MLHMAHLNIFSTTQLCTFGITQKNCQMEESMVLIMGLALAYGTIFLKRITSRKMEGILNLAFLLMKNILLLFGNRLPILFPNKKSIRCIKLTFILLLIIAI